MAEIDAGATARDWRRGLSNREVIWTAYETYRCLDRIGTYDLQAEMNAKYYNDTYGY